MRTSKVLLISLLLLAGCHQQPPQRPRPAVQVETVTLATSDGSTVLYSAVAEPKTTVPLAFRGPGYVIRIMMVNSAGERRELGEGDRVHRGDALASLREDEYQDQVDRAIAEVATARAAAQKARLEFERATRLFASQSITKPEMETATAERDATEAQLAASEAALQEARVSLSDTTLVAPIDGDVLKKHVELGAFMTPGLPAFVLGDVSAVKVVLGLPDVALQAIRLGQPVAVTTDALPGRKFTAKVSRIAAVADRTTRNFDVEVEITNRDRLWKPGMIASVALSPAMSTEPVPVLPLTAFVGAPGDRFAVMVIEGESPDTRARLRVVDLGEVLGNRVAVLNGLAPGERVITTGAAIVADGELVEVMPEEIP